VVLEQAIAPSVAPDTSAPAADLRAARFANSTPESAIQALILVILFAVPAIFWARTNSILDPDIWWHLRTGQWILEHHAIPRIDTFSSFAAGKPWQAYSWLFEVLVYKLYSTFGLLGIVFYTGFLTVAVTAALYHMLRRLQRDFSLVVLLTFAGAMCMGHLYTPRPWLFTILFFILELDILMQVRRTGRVRELFWLPAIFALWCNLHIQFFDGLVLLALASAESLSPSHLKTAGRRVHPLAIPAVSLACILTTFLNPYGPSLYKVAYELNAQTDVLNLINELKAVPFRDLADFILLLLALAGSAALARVPRLLPFETALFAFAAFVSFRSQRDVWVLATVAVAILAARLPGSDKAKDSTHASVGPLAAVAAALAVVVACKVAHVDNTSLRNQMSLVEPVQAVEFIQQRHFAGPLYNDFNWGGYVIFHLQNLPASVDGRTALMGEQHLNRAVATVGAQPGWSTDPQLAAAGTVLLPASAPLATLLQMDARFHLVYHDKTAMVFVAHQPALLQPKQ
jgi:hypothetical protein